MKRLSVVGVGAILLMACGGDEGPPPNAPPPVPATVIPPAPSAVAAPVSEAPAPKLSLAEEMKKTWLASHAAVNAHDVKAVLAHFSADAVKQSPGAEGWKEVKGEEHEKQLNALIAAAPDMKWTNTRALQRGDAIATEYVVTGSREGKKVGVRGLAIDWFDEAGKIRKERIYIDQTSFLVQTGRAPGLSVAVPAPTTDLVWIAAKNDASEDKLVDTFKGGWPVAWGKKDRKAYEALLTDDFTQDDVAWGTTFKGKTQAARGMELFVKAVPDVNVTVDSVWAAGDVVVAELTMKGTHKGALGPLLPTGKRFTVHLANVAEYKDGKLARSHVYMNTMEMLTQLGLAPKPAAAQGPTKPDATKPSAAKPETAKPEAKKPDAAKPDPKKLQERLDAR